LGIHVNSQAGGLFNGPLNPLFAKRLVMRQFKNADTDFTDYSDKYALGNKSIASAGGDLNLYQFN
jgi:hypothetical protein